MRVKRENNRRRGFSLIELMVVVVVIGVMAAMAVPSYKTTIEQSRSDLAIANLRAIWAAQRLHWIEKRTYSSSVSGLIGTNMLPADINTTDTTKDYIYAISGGTGFSTSFSATATRQNGNGWTGSFAINQDGVVTGSINRGATYINPPYMYR